MSVNNGQPANQTTFNDAFVSRTVDTSLSGIMDFLNTTDSTSPTTGAVKFAGGVGIAKNLYVGGVFNASQISGTIKTYATVLYAGNAQISLEANQSGQMRRVGGDAGAQTLNVLPFGDPSSIVDGAMIILVGTSDTNTVEIPFNDAQYGVYINGKAVLKRGYTLTLLWDAVLERFWEKGRNF